MVRDQALAGPQQQVHLVATSLDELDGPGVCDALRGLAVDLHDLVSHLWEATVIYLFKCSNQGSKRSFIVKGLKRKYQSVVSRVKVQNLDKVLLIILIIILIENNFFYLEKSRYRGKQVKLKQNLNIIVITFLRGNIFNVLTSHLTTQ